MKKIIGRVLVVLPPIALQVLWYVLAFVLLNKIFNGYLLQVITIVFTVLAVLFVTHIIGKRDESSYKLLWAIVIVGFPILGAILYLTLGHKSTGTKLKKKLNATSKALIEGKEISSGDEFAKIKNDDVRIGQTLEFINDSTGFPVYKNGTSKYYPFGEDMFADMCEDLKKAQKFVYIEYFIIQRGKFWDTMVDILAERAAHGVDVKVMYDDLGSIATYSVKDILDLKDKGIMCIPFNPFFLIKSQLNNRDHRKIMVIDGQVAYSGGVNLADEYINEIHPFGRWKDIGFRITGDAVKSYTYMFVEFWNAFVKEEDKKIDAFLIKFPEVTYEKDNGYILPYYDSPMRDEHTSNILFAEMLSSATDYVWFYTPYLMLGDALFDAFIRAARRGVDVRIIMPGIPDKKLVYRLSRSYYPDLVKAGVKVYEYTPGFVHAKGFIADGKVCGIGTVNLDYRSLFLHFECNSVFYKADIIDEIKKDYLSTLDECRYVTEKDVKKNAVGRFVDDLLKVIAPLL